MWVRLLGIPKCFTKSITEMNKKICYYVKEIKKSSLSDCFFQAILKTFDRLSFPNLNRQLVPNVSTMIRKRCLTNIEVSLGQMKITGSSRSGTISMHFT